MDPGRRISVVPKSHDGVLTEKQLVDYRDHRERFLSWLLNEGKEPKMGEGYAPYTVYSDAYRTARFDLWVWEQNGGYTYPPGEAAAHDYMEYLVYSDIGRVTKGKIQEAISHLSKWLHHTQGKDLWEFDYHFSSSGGNLEPRDYLSQEERRLIRESALNEGPIGSWWRAANRVPSRRGASPPDSVPRTSTYDRMTVDDRRKALDRMDRSPSLS